MGVYVDLLQQKTEKHVTIGVVDPRCDRADFRRLLPSQHQLSNSLISRLRQICQLAGIIEMVKGYKTCEISKRRRRKLGSIPEVQSYFLA